MELWELLILLVGFSAAIIGIGMIFMNMHAKIKNGFKEMNNSSDKDMIKYCCKKFTEAAKNVVETMFNLEQKNKEIEWEHEAEEDSEAADWKKTAKKYARKYYSLYNEKNGANKYDVDHEVEYINRFDYEDD